MSVEEDSGELRPRGMERGLKAGRRRETDREEFFRLFRSGGKVILLRFQEGGEGLDLPCGRLPIESDAIRGSDALRIRLRPLIPEEPRR